MLKIIKASEPIEVTRLNVCLYGAPGAGKSSLAFTSNKPLMLDFDNGAHRAANRKDSVRVNAWNDVAGLTEDDLADYATVIVDTAGRALDILTADIIRRNPKAGRGGALTLPGYGTLKAEFIAWLKQLNGFGKDVILVCHSEEKVNGDDIMERLDVQGGSKGEIYKAADAMGRVSIRNGVRQLNFNPTEAAFGKNPGRLDVLEIPHPDKDPDFLGGVVQSIKDRLNALTEEQTAAQEVLQQWRESIETLETAEDFNALLEAVKGQSKAIQHIFATAAAEMGLEYDKKAKAYADKVQA